MQKNRFLKNISWLGAASILVKPPWFIFNTILCIKYLGTQNYGILISTMSLSAISALITDLGTNKYATREIAKFPQQASLYFSNILSLRLGLSLLAWFGALVAGYILDYQGEAFTALIFASLYTLVLNITNFSKSIFQAFEYLKMEAILLVIEKTFVIGFGTYLLISTQTAQWTLAGMALGVTLSTLIGIIWISKNLTPFSLGAINRTFITDTLRSSFPLGIAGIFAILYYRTDAVMIEYMLGQSPTGQYGVAFKILDASILLPTLIIAGLFARFSNYWHQNQINLFTRLTKYSVLGLLALSTLLALAGMYYAPEIINLLASDSSFSPSIDALQILIWAFPFNCTFMVLTIVLTAMDEQNYLAKAAGLTFLLNFSTNLFAIPTWGIQGAAYTTVLTAIFLSLLLLFRCILVIQKQS